MILCIFKYTHVKSCNYIHNKWPRHEHIQTHIEPLDMQTIYSIRFHIWSSTHTHTCKTECLFMRRVSISEFARYRPLYPNMFKNDKLIAGAAVSESQKSNIEMVSWQVRLTDQVRYHQHSSRFFVGARLDGLLAPPASKLKNLAIRKSLGNRGWPHTHTFFLFCAIGRFYCSQRHGLWLGQARPETVPRHIMDRTVMLGLLEGMLPLNPNV